MKKLMYFALAAFALTIASCDPDDDGTQKPAEEPTTQTTTIAGEYSLFSDDFPETLVLKSDSSYSRTQELYKEEGTYSYTTSSITLTATHAWWRDWVRDEANGGPIVDANGNYQYQEWQDAELPTTATYTTKLLYQGEVLMLKLSDMQPDDQNEVWAPYINVKATHVSSISDIQGKWYWIYDFGDSQMRRLIINIDGDSAEVIITPWGERYTGTIRYEKGIVYMDAPTFTTTRYDDEDGQYEHMNEDDPESSDWRTPSGEFPYEGAFMGGLKFHFVADGNKAYGGMANLLATFTKQ